MGRVLSPSSRYELSDYNGTYAPTGQSAGGFPAYAGPADSHLTLQAYDAEVATLSGGVRLEELQWAPSPANPKVHVATLTPAQAGLLPKAGATSLRVGGERATRARYPNANPERDLFPAGYVTAKTEWVPPVYPPYNTAASKPCAGTGELCGASKTLTIPVKGEEWHGMCACAPVDATAAGQATWFTHPACRRG